MSDIHLNPMEDLAIDARDLTSEFKKLSLLLFRYYEKKADIERELDLAKQALDEIRSIKYKEYKNGPTKLSEAGVEASIDSDPEVKIFHLKMLDAKRDYGTWVGAVESLKAKKDMIIQMGSDRRKEI